MADNVKNEKKTVKTVDKDRDRKAKPNIGKRLLSFFTSLKAELKRVVWPDRHKLIHSTATVIAICVIAGLTLFMIDSVLGAALNGVGFYNTAAPTATVSTTAATTTTASGATSATTAATTVATTAAATTATSR